MKRIHSPKFAPAIGNRREPSLQWIDLPAGCAASDPVFVSFRHISGFSPNTVTTASSRIHIDAEDNFHLHARTIFRKAFDGVRNPRNARGLRYPAQLATVSS